MAALGQRLGVEVGLAAQLHDALGQLVGVGHFLVGMDQELVGDGRRGQTHGGEVMALVAHHAHQLGGQRVIEQLDDVLAPGPEMRGHGAIVQAALGSLQGLGVQRQVAVAGVGFGLLRGGAVGVHTGGLFIVGRKLRQACAYAACKHLPAKRDQAGRCARLLPSKVSFWPPAVCETSPHPHARPARPRVSRRYHGRSTPGAPA